MEMRHLGILVMNGVVRRYQKKDGSLTSAGKQRYKTQLQADIASSAANKNRRGATNVFTNQEASSIAINVKTKDSGVADAAKTLGKIGDSISEQYDEIFRVAENEALAALKDPNFKKDLDEQLYKLFGDGCNDKYSFDSKRTTTVMNLINSPKYSPETSKKVEQAKEAIDKYYVTSKELAKQITDGYGDETVASIRDTTVKYEDVVTDMIHRAAGSSWISYLYRHGEDYLFEDIDEIYDSSVYSMEEYNKKHA